MDVLAFALMATLLLGFHLPVPIQTFFDSFPFITYSMVTLGLLSVLLFGKNKRYLCFVLGVSIALTLLIVHAKHFYQGHILQQQNAIYVLQGQVINDQFPLECKGTSFCQHRVILKPEVINDDVITSSFFSPLLLLSIPEQSTGIQKGDVIRVNAKLNRPLGYENPFGFNMAKWAYARGILAKGKVIAQVEKIKQGNRLSQRFLNKLISQLEGYQHKAYFYPLLLAEQASLNSQQKEALQHYGLSHLFAISGLHIGIVFVVLGGLLQLLLFYWRCEAKTQITRCISLAIVWLYVGLIDFPIPSTRAAILLSLWLGLTQFHWQMNKVWLFSIMTAISLIIEPTGVLSAGWWLSVSAVAGIFIFNHLTASLKCTGLWSKLKSAVAFQFFISCWLLPLSLYWFSGVFIAGFWINLFLVPVFCFFVIPCLFLAAFFLMVNVQTVSALLFFLVDKSLGISLRLSNELSQLVSWLTLPSELYAAGTVIIVFVLLAKALSRTMHASLMLTLGLIIYASGFKYSNDKLKVITLDVGQGTSVLLLRNGQGFLYDLGPVYPSGFSATKSVVAPNLAGVGIHKLQHLVISHQDSDHKGDISSLKHFISETINTDCPDASIIWQQSKIVRLWPPKQAALLQGLSDNDVSCVLKVTDLVTKHTLILTGDISRDIELLLVEQHIRGHINLQSDVLFSSHHGSRFSSSYPFLKVVQPQIVIHTAGVFNHFGFPARQVKKRVNDMFAQQYSSSNWGQISLKFEVVKRQINVQTILNWWSPYWKKQNPFSFQVEIR